MGKDKIKCLNCNLQLKFQFRDASNTLNKRLCVGAHENFAFCCADFGCFVAKLELILYQFVLLYNYEDVVNNNSNWIWSCFFFTTVFCLVTRFPLSRTESILNYFWNGKLEFVFICGYFKNKYVRPKTPSICK